MLVNSSLGVLHMLPLSVSIRRDLIINTVTIAIMPLFSLFCSLPVKLLESSSGLAYAALMHF